MLLRARVEVLAATLEARVKAVPHGARSAATALTARYMQSQVIGKEQICRCRGSRSRTLLSSDPNARGLPCAGAAAAGAILSGSACARSPWDRMEKGDSEEGKLCGVLQLQRIGA